jgi:hypothetical protein
MLSRRSLLLALAAGLTPTPLLAQSTVWHLDGPLGSTFGRSIANAGDVDGDGVDDIVIGSVGDSAGGPGAGRVSVYKADGSTLIWSVVGVGTGGPFGAHDFLGERVEGVGDLNGDGRGEVLVTLGSAGQVRVLSGLDGSTLRSHTGSNNFGSALASTGDVDFDGVPDYLIGDATGLDMNGADTGLVRLYSGATGAVVYSVFGEAGHTIGPFGIIIPGDLFGISIASGEDFDGDGDNDFAVGAINNDNGGTDSGQVKVYDAVNGHLNSIYLGFFDFDNYGKSLAFLGDLDGDGKSELAIGAPGSDLNGSDAGVVDVIFTGPAPLYFLPGTSAAGDHLGTAVAAAGDLNLDGVPDLLAGLPDAGPSNEGIVLMIDGATGFTLGSVTGLLANDHLGAALAGGFDPDGDGKPEFAASAQDSDFGALNAGYVELFASDAATVSVVGTGCSPSGLTPILSVSQDPVVGQSLVASLSGASPLVPGSLVVAPGPPSSFTLDGCPVYVDLLTLPSWIYTPLVTDGLGV